MESFDFTRHDPSPLRVLCNSWNNRCCQSGPAPGLDSLDAHPRITLTSVHRLCGSQVR